ncbi:hypothetical protein EV715DRAFT_268181 [Schizophyllum commune]
MSPVAQQAPAGTPSPSHAFLRAKFRDVARMSAPRTKAEHLQSIHDLSFLLVVWARTYRAAWDHEDTPPGVVEYLADVVDGLALSAEEGELERSREDTLKRLRARAKEAESDTDKTPVKSTKDNKATATSPILASSIHLTFTGPQDASDCHPGLSQSLSGRTLVESPSETLFTTPCGAPDASSLAATPELPVPTTTTTISIPPPTELETIPEPTSPETSEAAPQSALTSPKPRPASEIPRPPAEHAASAPPDLTFAFPSTDRPPSHRTSTEHLHRSSHEHLHRSSSEHLHPSPSRARRGLAKSFSSTVRSLVSVSSRASEDDHSHSGHSFTSSSATAHSTAASSTDGHADSSATTVSANNSPTPSRKWSGLLGRTDGSVREHPAKLRKRHVSMHARAATAPAGELHTKAVSMGLGEIPQGLSEVPAEGEGEGGGGGEKGETEGVRETTREDERGEGESRALSPDARSYASDALAVG